MSLGVLSRTPASNSSTKMAGAPAFAFGSQQKKGRENEDRAPAENSQEPDSRRLASSSPMVISLASASPKPLQRAPLSLAARKVDGLPRK